MIRAVSQSLGLDALIDASFQAVDSSMALICYQMTAGFAMQHCQVWFDGNLASRLFPQAQLSSQAISRLL